VDEAHTLPAQTFRNVVDTVPVHIRLGLTATMVREDEKTTDLRHLVGPVLYKITPIELETQGHLAKAYISSVTCPLPQVWKRKYDDVKAQRAKAGIYSFNPTKLAVVKWLRRKLEPLRAKILICTDMLLLLNALAEDMGLTECIIEGATPELERTQRIKKFNDNEIDILLLSKVGDTALNIPKAEVMIQLSSQTGSRRQEAQRLGRILRPCSEGKKAYFYSLYTPDTREEENMNSRREYIQAMGYTYQNMACTSFEVDDIDNLDELMGVDELVDRIGKEDNTRNASTDDSSCIMDVD